MICGSIFRSCDTNCCVYWGLREKAEWGWKLVQCSLGRPVGLGLGRREVLNIPGVGDGVRKSKGCLLLPQQWTSWDRQQSILWTVSWGGTIVVIHHITLQWLACLSSSVMGSGNSVRGKWEKNRLGSVSSRLCLLQYSHAIASLIRNLHWASETTFYKEYVVLSSFLYYICSCLHVKPMDCFWWWWLMNGRCLGAARCRSQRKHCNAFPLI